MTETTEERVARAIYAAYRPGGDWEELTVGTMEAFMAMALAAMEAMRMSDERT